MRRNRRNTKQSKTLREWIFETNGRGLSAAREAHALCVIVREPSKDLNEQVQNTLDPLLEVMTRDYIDDIDLTGRLSSLFKVCGQIESTGRQTGRQTGSQAAGR